MPPQVLIVGAGPAGLAAASLLTEWCEKVTVIDARGCAAERQVGEHLPPASISLLSGAGFGELLHDEQHGYSPGVRSAWGESGWPVDKDYFNALPGRGLNLCRNTFDRQLRELCIRKKAELIFGTRLKHINRRDSSGYDATVVTDGKRQQLQADILIDASGRSASVARRLGAHRQRYDNLIGIVGKIEGCAASGEPGSEPGRLFIEAMRDGWWYGVQPADGPFVATFMADATQFSGSANTIFQHWQARLADSQLLAPIIAGGRLVSDLQVFDSATQWLDMHAEDDFIAIGDAAVAFDPLSSWGITKAISDACAAAEQLQQKFKGQADALINFKASQRESFNAYQLRHREVYRSETRWPLSPFWQARQQCHLH